jgi:hypothetical protein
VVDCPVVVHILGKVRSRQLANRRQVTSREGRRIPSPFTRHKAAPCVVVTPVVSRLAQAHFGTADQLKILDMPQLVSPTQPQTQYISAKALKSSSSATKVVCVRVL